MKHLVGNTQGEAKGVKTRKSAEAKFAEIKQKYSAAKVKIDATLSAAEAEMTRLMAQGNMAQGKKVRAEQKAAAKVAKEGMRPGGRTTSVYNTDLQQAHDHIGDAILDAQKKHKDLGTAIKDGTLSHQHLAEKGNDILASFNKKLQEAKRTMKGAKKKAVAQSAAKTAAAKEPPAHVTEGHTRSHKSRADRSKDRPPTRGKSRRKASSRGDDSFTH